MVTLRFAITAAGSILSLMELGGRAMMLADKRRLPRSRVLRRATMVLRGGRCTMPCVLVDLSPSGAQIRVDDWLMIPDSFELRVLHGPARLASVRHRTGLTAGVEFVDLPESGAA